MLSSWLKGERRTFGFRMHIWFALVLIGLTAALFGAGYWLLFRAVQERDCEVVRAQFEVYRTWYQQGGLPALMSQFFEQPYSGRELFFVRVCRATADQPVRQFSAALRRIRSART
jgi:hypothetical protein